MTLTQLLIPTYRQMLRALSAWLRTAQAEHRAADALMAERLADDMFPLSTQIRFACVQAREAVHRLRGEAIPAIVQTLIDEGRAGGERPGTIDAAIERIEETLAFLDDVSNDALDGGAEKPLALELPMGPAFDLDGDGYARDWALPQFYFHVMAAYAILRANGVPLGKADYVRHMFAFLRPGTAPTEQ